MSLVMMLAFLWVPTMAEDTCGEHCEHVQKQGIELLAVSYPPCPNDSTHRGRDFMNLGEEGHLVTCRICDAIILDRDDHIWSVDAPNCTEGMSCIACLYDAPGQEALGHIVYPEASNEYVSINTELHGHVCHREGCLYNPESDDYQYSGGYLEDEPSGKHMYLSPAYYTTYLGSTDGRWRHMKYQDCSYCNYVKYLGWFFCKYNYENCQGGCMD